MDIPNRISNRLREISAEVELAGKRQDFDAANRHVREGTQLKNLGEQYAQLVQRIETALSVNGTNPPQQAQANELRRLPVQVTGGMFRQRLLLLTDHVNHGRISVGENLEIEVPVTGEKFTTELLPDYKLRERGAIGHFYRKADINEGDVVVLIENAPGKWSLEKGQPGEWDGHFRYRRIRAQPISPITH